MSVVNTQSGVNNVYHYPAFNPIVNLNRLFRVPLTILQRSATRLSSKSYRAPWAFAAGEARLIKRALWSRRVLKMTFVVAGISFSKFQSMNLIISVSQSSAWDACCLISLHRGGGGRASRCSMSIRKCLYASLRGSSAGSNGVERAKLVANPLVSREELIRRPIVLSDELVPKQTGPTSIPRWKIVFPSISRNKCHDASLF